MSKIFKTGITTEGALRLKAGTASAGNAPLYFQQTGNTLLSSATQGAIEYDNAIFYGTPNASAGRAIDVNSFYHALQSARGLDFSVASTAQSWLGTGASTTVGLIVTTPITYKFDYYMALQYQSFGDTTTAISVGVATSFVAGVPVSSFTQFLEYGSNTTGFTTATTLSNVRTTAVTQVLTSPGASGSRYAIIKATGLIRTTGAGQIKIYPTIQTSAITANVINVQAGSYFVLTPLSASGTDIAMNGAWA